MVTMLEPEDRWKRRVKNALLQGVIPVQRREDTIPSMTVDDRIQIESFRACGTQSLNITLVNDAPGVIRVIFAATASSNVSFTDDALTLRRQGGPSGSVTSASASRTQDICGKFKMVGAGKAAGVAEDFFVTIDCQNGVYSGTLEGPPVSIEYPMKRGKWALRGIDVSGDSIHIFWKLEVLMWMEETHQDVTLKTEFWSRGAIGNDKSRIPVVHGIDDRDHRGMSAVELAHQELIIVPTCGRQGFCEGSLVSSTDDAENEALAAFPLYETFINGPGNPQFDWHSLSQGQEFGTSDRMTFVDKDGRSHFYRILAKSWIKPNPDGGSSWQPRIFFICDRDTLVQDMGWSKNHVDLYPLRFIHGSRANQGVWVKVFRLDYGEDAVPTWETVK